MMRILMISCSLAACKNMDWVASVLSTMDENEITTIVKAKSIKERYDKRSLFEIMKKAFYNYDAIVFFGSIGIAVRAVAPFVKSKTTDPAVIVMDESMQFVVPILSGHLGGANDLSRTLSTMSGAIPVITTATDIEDKFSVDDFARKNNLAIDDMNMAKEISVRILEGDEVGFVNEISKKALKGTPDFNEKCDVGILVTNKSDRHVFDKQLTLYPKNLYVGIGMKRGTSKEEIEKFIDDVLLEAGLMSNSIKCLATIDLKKDEEGLLRYAKDKRLKLKTFSAKQLRNVEGKFEASGFVKSVTGVDNVCERAALASTKGNGKLIIKKRKGNGITIAVAIRKK